MQWFDIQWKDTKDRTCFSNVPAEDEEGARTEFLGRVPGYARNGSELKSIDFIAPNAPMPDGSCW